jgi:hypothetical protein
MILVLDDESLLVPLLKERLDFPLVEVVGEAFLEVTVLQLMLEYFQVFLEL